MVVTMAAGTQRPPKSELTNEGAADRTNAGIVVGVR